MGLVNAVPTSRSRAYIHIFNKEVEGVTDSKLGVDVSKTVLHSPSHIPSAGSLKTGLGFLLCASYSWSAHYPSARRTRRRVTYLIKVGV